LFVGFFFCRDNDRCYNERIESDIKAHAMYFTEDKYTKAYDFLAKLRDEEFGEETRDYRTYPIGPRWFKDRAEAFDLLVTELKGYYEARERTPEHCIVIGHDFGDAVVVRLHGHGTKARALTYAIVLAVTAITRGRMQQQIDEIAAPGVYQQAVLRPGVTPKHNWLDWLNKRVETKTVYRGVYPAEKLVELRAMSVRELVPADVPGMTWDSRWEGCKVREDGAIIHPRDHEFEIGSLDDAGGITWILLPEPILS
jgi:hypothetical protein